MSKRILSLLLAFAIVFGSFSFVAAEGLTDIEGHWGEEAITYLYNKGVVTGHGGSGKGTFAPKENITRAEFATMVNKALGFTEEAEVEFTDVDEDDWFHKQVAIAVAADYIKGDGDGTFRPGDDITRQEAATMISEAYGLEQVKEAAKEFKDADKISNWAVGFVNAVKEAGFIVGDPDGSFRPLDDIIRAEAAQIVYGMVLRLEEDNDEEAELVVEEVNTINDITVDYGTLVEDIELLEEVRATLNDGEATEVTLDLKWTADKDYDGEEAGDYTFQYLLSAQEDEELDFEIPKELAEGTITVTVLTETQTALNAAEEAVGKYESTKLFADKELAEAAVEKLSGLVNNSTKGQFLDRIADVDEEVEAIVEAVNKARTQAQLEAALSNSAFKNVNTDYIVEYEEELVAFGERNYSKIDDIQSAVDVVNVREQISELPKEVTLESKADIEAARKAYDALTAEQQELVDETALVNAEAALAPLLLAQHKKAAIEELKNYVDAKDYTLNADALEDAIKAGERNINSSSTIAWVDNNLANAKAAIDEILTDEEQEALDLVKNVQALISRFTQAQIKAYTVDEERVLAAREAYDELAEDLQKKVGSAYISKLEAAERALDGIVENASELNAALVGSVDTIVLDGTFGGFVVERDNLTITGGTIDDSGLDYGITVNGAEGVVIDGVTFIGGLNNAIRGQATAEFTVKNSTINIGSGTGVYVNTSYQDNVVTLTALNNEINAGTGIGGTENSIIKVEGNSFDTRTEAIGLGQGVRVKDVEDIVKYLESNNTFEGKGKVVDYR